MSEARNRFYAEHEADGEYRLDSQGRNHLYDDGRAVHACIGRRMDPGNPGTYIVWTVCNTDVPGASFKSRECVTCRECLERMA